MNSPVPRAKRAAMDSPKYSEKTLTFRASSGRPLPSSREMREPPPMPASPARHRVMLNTGRMREVEATMYGLLVRPTKKVSAML